MWRNVYTIVIILIVLVAEDAWSSFYSSTRTWSHFNAPSSSANCNTRATRPCWYIFSSSPYLPSSNYSQLLTNGLQSSCANLSSLLIIMCSIHFHFSNSHPSLFYTLPFHPPFIAACLLCVPFIFYSTQAQTRNLQKWKIWSIFLLLPDQDTQLNRFKIIALSPDHLCVYLFESDVYLRLLPVYPQRIYV